PPTPPHKGEGSTPSPGHSSASTAKERALVIALSVLPLSPLQPEPRDQDGGEQEWNHGGGGGRALAAIAAAHGALVGERRHPLRGGCRDAPRGHPEELGIAG